MRESIKGIGEYYKSGKVAATFLQQSYERMLEDDLFLATPDDEKFYSLVSNELLNSGQSKIAGFGTLNVNTWTARTLTDLQTGKAFTADQSKYVRLENAHTKSSALDFATRNFYSNNFDKSNSAVKSLFVAAKIQPVVGRGDSVVKNNFGRFSVAQVQNKKGVYVNYVRFNSADGLEKKLGD